MDQRSKVSSIHKISVSLLFFKCREQAGQDNFFKIVCMHNKFYYICYPSISDGRESFLQFLSIYKMKREETIDHNIKTAWHAIARMYNQQAAKQDITTSIGFVLLNISSREGTPATKIAPLMGLESRSLTRVLKNMEEKGLIYREPDRNDKRSVRIYLTEKGKKKKEVSRQTVLRFNEVIRHKIPEEKLQVFFEVINDVNEIIETNNIYPKGNNN